MFMTGAMAAGILINRRQDRLAAHLVDGRRIQFRCAVRNPQSPRWTSGRFVVDSGLWSWEPCSTRGDVRTLPADLRLAQVLPQGAPEAKRTHFRSMIIKCSSSQGDVLIATVPGQIEHLYMALTRA
ncbi:hypothetical protein AB0M28_18405 [Streptomyces sp. NPDC051940]|uniref:hypothetical protein n=1 Tax=Streptomyces sp. NPDC051940 TaxID=3155675 RepID=UPI00342E2BE7